MKAAQIRDRMADVDADQLPTVKEAQQQARQPMPEPSQVVEIKEDLFDQVARERAQRSEAQKAADALRRQEKKPTADRSRDHER
jgi:hypothetical protein